MLLLEEGLTIVNRSNYNEARPLLVIFHDPPDARGVPSIYTSKLELHNIWVVGTERSPVLSLR